MHASGENQKKVIIKEMDNRDAKERKERKKIRWKKKILLSPIISHCMAMKVHGGLVRGTTSETTSCNNQC